MPPAHLGQPALPPSVQAVADLLAAHHPITGAQIREETGLPRRTVYAALQRLKKLGILRERVSLKDTRQTYFWIAEGAPQQP
jgi:predicted transcriptional regulator